MQMLFICQVNSNAPDIYYTKVQSQLEFHVY